MKQTAQFFSLNQEPKNLAAAPKILHQFSNSDYPSSSTINSSSQRIVLSVSIHQNNRSILFCSSYKKFKRKSIKIKNIEDIESNLQTDFNIKVSCFHHQKFEENGSKEQEATLFCSRSPQNHPSKDGSQLINNSFSNKSGLIEITEHNTYGKSCSSNKESKPELQKTIFAQSGEFVTVKIHQTPLKTASSRSQKEGSNLVTFRNIKSNQLMFIDSNLIFSNFSKRDTSFISKEENMVGVDSNMYHDEVASLNSFWAPEGKMNCLGKSTVFSEYGWTPKTRKFSDMDSFEKEIWNPALKRKKIEAKEKDRVELSESEQGPLEGKHVDVFEFEKSRFCNIEDDIKIEDQLIHIRKKMENKTLESSEVVVADNGKVHSDDKLLKIGRKWGTLWKMKASRSTSRADNCVSSGELKNMGNRIYPLKVYNDSCFYIFYVTYLTYNSKYILMVTLLRSRIPTMECLYRRFLIDTIKIATFDIDQESLQALFCSCQSPSTDCFYRRILIDITKTSSIGIDQERLQVLFRSCQSTSVRLRFQFHQVMFMQFFKSWTKEIFKHELLYYANFVWSFCVDRKFMTLKELALHTSSLSSQRLNVVLMKSSASGY